MKQHGPWKIKSSEVKYVNKWMEVREDKVIRPDGQDGVYSVVKMRSGVSILPLDQDGNVYLVNEFRYAVGEEMLTTAGGVVDKNEDVLGTAKRELEEELGILAEEWIDLGDLNPFTGSVYAPAKLYLARSLKFVPTRHEGTELISRVKVTFEYALEMVMESKITCGQSSVLILKAAKYLGRL